jgi:hypothetical protein
MVALPVRELTSLHAVLASASDKGKALEEFCAVFFEAIPGVHVAERRVLDDAHSQEVDLVLDNTQHPDGLPSFGTVVLAEAKNWTARVGSAEVAWFDWKVRLSGHQEGFFIATNGVTGRADDASSAWQIAFFANVEHRRLIVLSPAEMLACTISEDFQALVQSKMRRLATLRSGL